VGRGIRLQSMTVPLHLEEDPEAPDEPVQPEQPGDGAAAATSLVPTVALPTREWEYSTQVLTVAQVADGTSLIKVLKSATKDGWELAEIVDGGDKRVLLLRRSKRSPHDSRRVGFAPPTRT